MTRSSSLSQKNSRTFSFGIGALPFLADHGFQNLVVLPGSLFVAIAASIHREFFRQEPRFIENIRFVSPVILSASDSVIQAEFTDTGRAVEYRFYEQTGGPTNSTSFRQEYTASLEIARDAAGSAGDGEGAFSISDFQGRTKAVIGSDEFYGALRQNGNEYGPAFQNISCLWRDGDEVLGTISAPHQRLEPELYFDSILLDAMTQLLSPFAIDKRQTFILRSIDKIEVVDFPRAASIWGHARLSASEHLSGNVRIFDDSGASLLKISGVAFELLQRLETSPAREAARLVISANFTAEPVEDSLRFWGDYFDSPLQVEFAAYNQIFQQLLDPASAFRKNVSGTNLILLALEEWAQATGHSLNQLSQERAEECFRGRKRFTLPNGMEIAHLNPYETEYVYNEVFEDRCYLKHGIRLSDSATVVDIGANIGLFSLFVMSRLKGAKIYAFEPAPAAFDALQANCAAYGSNVKAFNLGVSEKPGTATFTFYENSSVFSGFHSDEAEDREAIEAVVRNMLKRVSFPDDSLDEYVNELSAERLHRSTHQCHLTTVSEIIRENRIEKIDLLKIDAEKSEVEILLGISDEDWRRIDQIVVEVHDRSGKRIRQVQEILGEHGYRCSVRKDKLLEDSGLVNLYAIRKTASAIDSSETSASEPSLAILERNVRDFSAALQAFMKQSSAPLVICICPHSPAAVADAHRKTTVDAAERELTAQLRDLPNVAVIDSATLARLYPVTDYYDSHTYEAGHIPYTQQAYAAIGTALFRTIYSRTQSPYKAIVLDCDNTLWKGVCGEDGPSGIQLTAPHQALQEFMLEQMKAGMLLCLCSKNNEQDVFDVFAQRADMRLRRENLVACRINWKSKSENIKSLAGELNLGLDSFIFIDDSPVDCADVRSNCPEVLTLQLPQDPEQFPAFLEHIWAFDHAGSTIEDQSRTRMYQDSAERERFREQAPSLKDFIAGLELRIDIDDAAEADIPRISQLTFRTSQFNLTTIRRSESEVREFLKRENGRCMVVRVKDRFGDYGLVGVLMYEIEAQRYTVDTFLLSCRVLGRGVEHAVLRHIGQQALRDGKTLVELSFQRTEKNLPALEFLRSIGSHHGNASRESREFAADFLARLEYTVDQSSGTRLPAASVPGGKLTQAAPFSVPGHSDRLQRIGEQLNDVNAIASAIEEFRPGRQQISSAEVVSGDQVQAGLIKIWQRVLGRSRIGVNENFFEAGGTSLKAVQVLAMIKKEFQQSLSIASIFECPTVSLLAGKLKAGTEPSHPEPSGAALRGRQRRYKTARNPGR